MTAIDRPDAEKTIVVDAPAEHVWHVISDVTRTGEWSPACHRCEWTGVAKEPVVGAEFVGHNKFNGLRWSRQCRVTSADEGREFAFSTYVKGKESTRWRYRLEPAGYGRTQVTESYQVVSTPMWVKLMRKVPTVAETSDRQMELNLRQSLERIKAIVEDEVGRTEVAQEGR